MPLRSTRVSTGVGPMRSFILGILAAFTVPVAVALFVLLIFGMVEYGRMVMVQQVLTNASREGARRAVGANATTSAVSTTVTDYLTNSAISGATV